MKNIIKIFLIVLSITSVLEARDKWKELGFTSLSQFQKFTVELKDYGKSIGMLKQLGKVDAADIAAEANSYFEKNELNMFTNPFTSAISGMENLPDFLLEVNPVTLKDNLWNGYLRGEQDFVNIQPAQFLSTMKSAKRSIENFKTRYDQPIKIISTLKGAKLKPIKVGLNAKMRFPMDKKNKKDL